MSGRKLERMEMGKEGLGIKEAEILHLICILCLIFEFCGLFSAVNWILRLLAGRIGVKEQAFLAMPFTSVM